MTEEPKRPALLDEPYREYHALDRHEVESVRCYAIALEPKLAASKAEVARLDERVAFMVRDRDALTAQLAALRARLTALETAAREVLVLMDDPDYDDDDYLKRLRELCQRDESAAESCDAECLCGPETNLKCPIHNPEVSDPQPDHGEQVVTIHRNSLRMKRPTKPGLSVAKVKVQEEQRLQALSYRIPVIATSVQNMERSLDYSLRALVAIQDQLGALIQTATEIGVDTAAYGEAVIKLGVLQSEVADLRKPMNAAKQAIARSEVYAHYHRTMYHQEPTGDLTL